MKRLLAILIITTFVLTLAPTFLAQAETITFSDVDATTTRGQAIYKLVKAGVVLGYPDGTFRPDAEITRAELCKIVNLIFGYTEKEENDPGFSDVTGDWYYDYVMAAKKAGYVKGYDDGTFRPDNKITREETATILTRVANVYDLGFTVVISDPVSDWAMPYVQKVVTNYLMPIEAGDTFRATQNATRAEFCEAFASFAKEVAPEDTKPEDNKPEEKDPTTQKPIEDKDNGGFTGNTGEIVGGGDTEIGDSDVEDDEPPVEEDFAIMNSEIITNLTAAKTDLEYAVFDTDAQIEIVGYVYGCVVDALDNHVYIEEVDVERLKSLYSYEIEQVGLIISGMTDQEKSDFERTALVELSGATLQWIRDLGIDI